MNILTKPQNYWILKINDVYSLPRDSLIDFLKSKTTNITPNTYDIAIQFCDAFTPGSSFGYTFTHLIYNLEFDSNMIESLHLHSQNEYCDIDKHFPFISLCKPPQKQKSVSEKKVDTIDGLYACKKCKSRKTRTLEIQTRRADEGMTLFVECTECSSRYRVH
jgi:DNA-directed RNA polymerase subunit M/transcription elongation factor TFIIS